MKWITEDRRVSWTSESDDNNMPWISEPDDNSSIRTSEHADTNGTTWTSESEDNNGRTWTSEHDGNGTTWTSEPKNTIDTYVQFTSDIKMTKTKQALLMAGRSNNDGATTISDEIPRPGTTSHHNKQPSSNERPSNYSFNYRKEQPSTNESIIRHKESTKKTYTCTVGRKVSPTEDIMCMKPFNYLTNYKNPCWYPSNSSQIFCLPYFMQIGMSKCGTTDIFNRLIKHPDIVPFEGYNGDNKNIYWWNLKLTGSTWSLPFTGGYRESLQKYTEYFSRPAAIIQNDTDESGYHRKITGEGSPTYLWMLYLWRSIPQNINLTEPLILIPDQIKHLLPNTKFIVSLRDPVERVYSSYHYFNYLNRKTPYDRYTFHEDVLSTMKEFHKCLKVKSPRLCILDENVQGVINPKVRLLNSFYYFFLIEWLDVFPREQFIFIKMEDYVQNKEATLNRIFKFLNITTLTRREMNNYDILYRKIKNKTKGDKRYEPMLNSTREILYKLYTPYTEMLPRLLGDPNFTWTKLSYDDYVKRYTEKQNR